jgi:diguanylate cyclase (GGDEF)-like protein
VSLDFLADESDSGGADAAHASPWKIAIIDDMPDVHDTTKLALEGLRFEDRGVSFIGAYSAEGARTLLREHPDTAVALVDVVMESDTAGLELVEWIRETLGNRLIRIILRTGQPGYAPETDVIVRYEIDDYKEKTELSRTKLVTALITAFRGYRQIDAIERNRVGLERLINSLSTLYSRQALDEFANGILGQLGALLDVQPDGLVCAVDTPEPDDGPCYRILAAGGELEAYTGEPIDRLPSPTESNLIRRCIETGQTISEAAGTALALTTHTGAKGAVFIKLPPAEVADGENDKLLRLFAINASTAYENASLFEETRNLAFTDPVTGLPSFGAFCKTLESAREDGRRLLVGLFDIYKFREISDGLGEERAEVLLQKIGERLRTNLADVLTVARREGDEFAILFERNGELDPEGIIARIDKAFEEPVVLDDASLAVRGRLGLARVDEDGKEPRTLARYATIALNELRRNAKGRVKLFDPALQETASERLRLASMLTGSSSKAEFEVVFQPVLDTVSGRLSAAEALLRFYDHNGEMLPTGRMIDAAEANGLIVELGASLLVDAMRQHVRVMDPNAPHRINVNLSPAQVQTQRIYSDFRHALAQTGLPPALLNVEVTENLFLTDDADTLALLDWLREQGARIYIDDFGTGYSSLSYLGKLPVDGLKIDRSFVMRMADDPQAAAVVGAIVAIGTKLGLDVVAEGVETEPQRRMLAEMGADKLQGFLFAKPGAADTLAPWR